MPKPIKRHELIRRLKAFGFTGPFTGKRHQQMRKGQHTVPIPNPHGSGDLDWALVKRIINQANIDAEAWNAGAPQPPSLGDEQAN